MAGINPQRPAVGGQLLHIEDHQAVPSENLLDAEKGEIGEMLMINRVELNLLNEPDQMGKFHRNGAAGFQRRFQPSHKIVEIGIVGQHIVADDQIRLSPLLLHFFPIDPVEKGDFRGNAVCQGHRRRILGRFNTENGNVIFFEILQKITVIAGNLHDG